MRDPKKNCNRRSMHTTTRPQCQNSTKNTRNTNRARPRHKRESTTHYTKQNSIIPSPIKKWDGKIMGLLGRFHKMSHSFYVPFFSRAFLFVSRSFCVPFFLSTILFPCHSFPMSLRLYVCNHTRPSIKHFTISGPEKTFFFLLPKTSIN